MNKLLKNNLMEFMSLFKGRVEKMYEKKDKRNPVSI